MIDERIKTKQRTEGVKKGIYLLPNLITSASLFGGFRQLLKKIILQHGGTRNH